MSWDHSEDAKAYVTGDLPVDVVAELGSAGHYIDVDLLEEGTPGTVTVKTAKGVERVWPVRKSKVILCNIIEVTAISAEVAGVRVHVPFAAVE